MVEKTVVPFMDGRVSATGLWVDRGGMLRDRAAYGAGVSYRFDLSDMFASTITAVMVTRGCALVGDLQDHTFLLLFDGTIHRTDDAADRAPVSDIDLAAYSETGEVYTTRLSIEEVRPGGHSIVHPCVDDDGFLVDGHGNKLTNAHGFWLRFARVLRRVKTLGELVHGIEADGGVLAAADDMLLVWHPTEEIRGGDRLSLCAFRTKAELTRHGIDTGSGPLMLSDTEELKRAGL